MYFYFIFLFFFLFFFLIFLFIYFFSLIFLLFHFHFHFYPVFFFISLFTISSWYPHFRHQPLTHIPPLLLPHQNPSSSAAFEYDSTLPRTLLPLGRTWVFTHYHLNHLVSWFFFFLFLFFFFFHSIFFFSFFPFPFNTYNSPLFSATFFNIFISFPLASRSVGLLIFLFSLLFTNLFLVLFFSLCFCFYSDLLFSRPCLVFLFFFLISSFLFPSCFIK